MSGLATLVITGTFGLAVVITGGDILRTRGWAPIVNSGTDAVIAGALLMVIAAVGLVGLAFDDADQHRWPRIVSLISAGAGILWFGLAAWSFAVAWIGGYENGGAFPYVCGAVLHANRLYVLAPPKGHRARR